MNLLIILNNFEKFILLSIFVSITYMKIINYKRRKNSIKLILYNIFATCLCLMLKIYLKQIIIFLIIYVFWIIIISAVLKQKWNYSIFVLTISAIFSYILYLISILISGLILKMLIPAIDYQSPISLFTIPIIMTIIYYFIQRIKRLKNGIIFLRDIDKIDKIGKISNIINLIMIIIFEILQDNNNTLLNTMVVIIALSIFCYIIVWLQTQITKHYKKHMKDRTIEIQKTEIDEQVKLIEEIKEENLRLATTVHKYNNRLSAIELAMKEAISNNLNTEFANELSVILKETEELSKNFAKESNVVKNNLPLTNIPGVDNMFEYMQEEAIKSNINFDLKINESIHDLLENIIPKDKFETLLGDHLRDAIIAVNFSNSSYKSILTTLGIVENCYELSIYDTGIEFEINTLLKLGKEQVTTHKDTGGSGIGFITTFETLKATKASLIIEEYNPKTTNYTKSVNIRFDGKGEYRIYSYRAEDIKNQNKEKRIIIKNIE